GLKSEGTLRSFKKSRFEAGFLQTLRGTAKRFSGRNDSGSLSLSRRVGLDHRPRRRASANYRRHVEWHRRAEAGFRLARRPASQNRPTEEFVARQTLATRITARRSGVAEPIQRQLVRDVRKWASTCGIHARRGPVDHQQNCPARRGAYRLRQRS